VQTLQLRDNKWRQVKMDTRQETVRSFFKSLPIGPTAAASARAISVPISVQG
jgi:hypothetical protein